MKCFILCLIVKRSMKHFSKYLFSWSNIKISIFHIPLAYAPAPAGSIPIPFFTLMKKVRLLHSTCTTIILQL